jgi:DNA-binding protein YbaB
LKINPEAVDPDDVDMLSDLIVAAVNDGLDKVEQATQAKMGKYTRGLGM